MDVSVQFKSSDILKVYCIIYIVLQHTLKCKNPYDSNDMLNVDVYVAKERCCESGRYIVLFKGHRFPHCQFHFISLSDLMFL